MAEIHNSDTAEQIKEKLYNEIQKVLNEQYNKDSEGNYSVTLYFDYNDYLSDQTIQEILQSKNPRETFYDKITDAYSESLSLQSTEITNTVLKELKKNEIFEALDNTFEQSIEDMIENYIDLHVYVLIPYDHFLNQTVLLNIVIDTGDLNTDFTENNLMNYYAPDFTQLEEGEELVSDESSLLWLCETQGITKTELEEAIKERSGYKDDALYIVLLKNTLDKELEKLGKDLVSGRYHTGAYKRYLELADEKNHLYKNLKQLQQTYEANSISFSDYQNIVKEKNLPMNISDEAAFQERQKRVLENLKEKIYIIEEKIKSLNKTDPEVQKTEILMEELHNLIQEKYIPLSKTDAFKKMQFLDSVLDESRESTTHMNALTFCVKMPFEQALNIQEIINREKEYNKSYYAFERT